jgi:hypothetical protein
VPSGSDDVASENATITAHEIPLGLFSARLRVVAQASCLYTIVRGTPNLGYRQDEIAMLNEQLRQEVARLGKALYDKKDKAKHQVPR